MNLIDNIEYIGIGIGIIGFIATIASIIITKKMKNKQLCVAFSNYFVIKGRTDALGDLEIKYREIKIDSLTITKIALWNKQNIVRRNEIATKEPIKIHATDDAHILDVSIVFCDEKNNVSISYSTEDDSYIVDFEYLERKEGMVIQILHTGGGVVEVSGKIIGGKSIKQVTPNEDSNDARIGKRKLSQVLNKVLMFSIIPLIIISNIVFFSPSSLPSIDEYQELQNSFAYTGIPKDFLDFFIVIFINAMLILMFLGVYSIESSPLIPKKLRIYDKFNEQYNVEKSTKEIYPTMHSHSIGTHMHTHIQNKTDEE